MGKMRKQPERESGAEKGRIFEQVICDLLTNCYRARILRQIARGQRPVSGLFALEGRDHAEQKAKGRYLGSRDGRPPANDATSQFR